MLDPLFEKSVCVEKSLSEWDERDKKNFLSLSEFEILERGNTL
jgi:hypothetical protein